MDGGAPELRVLFVGNSYTYFNDLPGMLGAMSAPPDAGPRIVTEKVAVGGAALKDHWAAGRAQERIRAGRWTHVVLQGHSTEPLDAAASFEQHAHQFGALVADAGAIPVWYVTWARAPRPDGGYLFAGGPVKMQERLTSQYAKVAGAWPTSVLACVGPGFATSLRAHPELHLHREDLTHPTVAGSYLAASALYLAITGSPVPEGRAIPDGLTAAQASALREAALASSRCAVHLHEGP